MSALILSTDAAAGLRRPHADLSAALDRARSMLPPDQADALMEPVDLMGWEGPERRAYRLPREALVFMYTAGAPRHEILWLADALRQPHRIKRAGVIPGPCRHPSRRSSSRSHT